MNVKPGDRVRTTGGPKYHEIAEVHPLGVRIAGSGHWAPWGSVTDIYTIEEQEKNESLIQVGPSAYLAIADLEASLGMSPVVQTTTETGIRARRVGFAFLTEDALARLKDQGPFRPNVLHEPRPWELWEIAERGPIRQVASIVLPKKWRGGRASYGTVDRCWGRPGLYIEVKGDFSPDEAEDFAARILAGVAERRKA